MCTPTSTTPPSGRRLQLVLLPHLPGSRVPPCALLPAPHLPAVTVFGLRCHHTFSAVARLGMNSHQHHTSKWSQASACTHHQSAVADFGLHCHHTFPVVVRLRMHSHQHHTSRWSRALACTVTTPSRWSRASAMNSHQHHTSQRSCACTSACAATHPFFFCFSF